MEVKHTIDIDFVARNNTPVVHLTQYDDGLPLLVVRTFQNGSPLVLSSEELTASLRFMKQDGNFVLSPGTITEKEISFKIPSSMTVFQGKYPGKVELKDATGQIICSATIIFDIDKNPVQKDVVESDSDYKDYINKVLGQIPGFDAYTKTEADAKFATKQYVDTTVNDDLVEVTPDQDYDDISVDCSGKKRYYYQTMERSINLLLYGIDDTTDVDLILESFGNDFSQGDVGIMYGDTVYPVNFGSFDFLMLEYNNKARESQSPIRLYIKIMARYGMVYAYCVKGWSDGPEIVQETGESTVAVMSQYAVTEALANVTSAAEEANAELVTSLIDQPTAHATNTIGNSEVALQSGKRYFIEGTDGSQSPQVTMVLNNVTAKTNIEVFCKFAHNVILALEHPNTTLETYGGGDLETKIAALNEASRTGTGYLHLRFVGLQANQCAVLILN